MFIHTGRRGGDRQLGKRGHTAKRWPEDRAVPHLPADKPEGTTGEGDRPRNPQFQCREIKPENLWL